MSYERIFDEGCSAHRNCKDGPFVVLELIKCPIWVKTFDLSPASIPTTLVLSDEDALEMAVDSTESFLEAITPFQVADVLDTEEPQEGVQEGKLAIA